MRSIIIFTTNSEHFSMRPQADQLIKAGGKKVGPAGMDIPGESSIHGAAGI